MGLVHRERLAPSTLPYSLSYPTCVPVVSSAVLQLSGDCFRGQGPCWTPEGATSYEGDGQPQRWPVIEDDEEETSKRKRTADVVDLEALAPKSRRN